jgi:hypothetical protein
MDLEFTVIALLWALLVWVVATAAAVAVVAAVVASLPPDYFLDEPGRRSRGLGWPLISLVARNGAGCVLIVVGAALSIPGVPGPGLVTVLAGVILLDFPGRHRLARGIARVPGVLPAMNRIRRLLRRPPLSPPAPGRCRSDGDASAGRGS